MKFSTLQFARPDRSQIRAALYASKPEGTSDHAIHEVTDLAIHAAEQARTKLLEVIDTAGSANISTPAFGTAVSLLLADCNALHSAVREFGERKGGLFEVEVGVE